LRQVFVKDCNKMLIFEELEGKFKGKNKQKESAN